MRHLSIKALILSAFGVILLVITAASVTTLVQQQRLRDALVQHEQVVRALTTRTGMDLTEVLTSLQTLDPMVSRVNTVALLTRVFSVLIGAWLAWQLYRRVVRLVQTTEGFARRIEQGAVDTSFSTQEDGETAQLARALNAMVQRLRDALQREAAAHARLQYLLDSAPLSIYAARTSGDYGATYISDTIRQQLGHAPEDFTGNPGFWCDHVHPDDQPWVLAHQAGLLSGQPATAIEYRFQHRDGSWRWMHDESCVVRDAQGQASELVGSWMDVTLRKSLELSLARRDAILQSVGYGSSRFLQEVEAPQAQWNLALEAVLARLGEAVGVQRVWLASVTGDSSEDWVLQPVRYWAEPAFMLMSDGTQWLSRGVSFWREGLTVEALRLRRGEWLQIKLKDLSGPARTRFERLNIESELVVPVNVGATWWGVLAFDDCGTAPLWHENEIEAMRAAAAMFGTAYSARADRESLHNNMDTLNSVLEQVKRQSAAIERQNRELTRLNRMKSEFLATITHELRTPLNGVLGFAGLLEDGVGGALSPLQKAHLGEITGAGRELLALINRLLELAQFDAGATQLARADCDVATLLAAGAQAQELAARARGITLELSACTLHAPLDATLMRQALGALLDNAIKFSPDGGVVTLSGVRSADGTALDIAVRDQGVGIDPADQQRIFAPFVQLDAALARRFGGAGLGLSLAQRIAHLHGGEIRVQSAPGRGSCFTIHLPMAPAAPAQ